MTASFQSIQAAALKIKPYLEKTPVVLSPALSKITQEKVYLKLETQNPTASFKVRGACHAILNLPPEKRKNGVIAMSAGNHAQAVAYFAGLLGIKAKIIMPLLAPFTKVQRTEALGAEVILRGETLNDAYECACQIAEKEGLSLIHPYDDADVIAGQGTIGLELAEALPDIEILIVPIGGGGLISGIALALKSLNPSIRIYGVQSALFPSMKDALEGKPVHGGGISLAEGISVKTPGQLTLPIVKQYVEDILLVDESAIESAIYLMASEQKIISEGAGAAGVAAILSYPEKFRGRRLATVICGGNIDSRLLSSLLMRGLAREGHLARLRIDIVDAPGSLAHVAQIIAETGSNIVEVYHHRLTRKVMAKGAELDIVLETKDHQHIQKIIAALEAEKFSTELLSDVD